MNKVSEFWVIIRLLLTGWLLFVVWHHVHWSVALILTLQAVAWEVQEYTKYVKKENEKLDEAFAELVKPGPGVRQQITKKG